MAVKKVIEKAVEISTICVWTCFVIIRLLIDMVRKGPRAVLYVKDRPVTPKVLTEGWNHAFVRLSTVRLHYVHAGNKDKPLMLFLHGYPEFWYSWRYQLEAFKQDYWCVAVDQRGYNESDRPAKVSDYTVQFLSQDVNELVKALGYTSCVLVAHDWGGAVAWHTAQVYPHIVDKLIVCNCPHGKVFGQHLKSSLKQFFMSWYMFFFQVPWLPELAMRAGDHKFLYQCFTDNTMGLRNKQNMSDEDMEAWKYVFGRPGAYTGPINYYRAAFQYTDREELQRLKQQIQPPTLVIWGTRDGALNTAMAQQSIAQCRAGTLRLVEGASHWVQQDEPNQVNTFIKEFLGAEHKMYPKL